MTEPQTSRMPNPLDPEAVATARLVLPLVLTRLEADPQWSLAMLDAVRTQLTRGDSDDASSSAPTLASVLSQSAGEALALAHAHAVKDDLANATVLAQLALRNPDELGSAKANAKLLLASLLERQGCLIEAAKIVGEACDEAPEDENARGDRDRIVKALREKAEQALSHEKAQKVSLLAQVIATGGWNFGDAKRLSLAALSVLKSG